MSSSPGSAGSSGLTSPTVAPTALHLHGISEPAYPDAGRYLRHQLGLSPDKAVNLGCLPDPLPGRKPSQAYPILIKLAIYGSPEKKLTLNGIYRAIENRFEYFKTENSGAWKVRVHVFLHVNQYPDKDVGELAIDSTQFIFESSLPSGAQANHRTWEGKLLGAGYFRRRRLQTRAQTPQQKGATPGPSSSRTRKRERERHGR